MFYIVLVCLFVYLWVRDVYTYLCMYVKVIYQAGTIYVTVQSSLLSTFRVYPSSRGVLCFRNRGGGGGGVDLGALHLGV